MCLCVYVHVCVLKLPRFILVRYVKLCRHENDCHKGKYFTKVPYKQQAWPYKHRATWEGTRVSEKAKGESLYHGFCRKKQARQGMQVKDWIVQIISSSSGAEQLSLVTQYLALG